MLFLVYLVIFNPVEPPGADVTSGNDFLDSVMRCGLYLGAVFQLICLAAVVMAPDRAGDTSSQGKVIWVLILNHKFHVPQGSI